MKHRHALHIAVLLLVASCSPIVDNRGHNPEQSDFSQIIKGQSREEDVEAVLGSPTTKASYGENTWYYISTRKETRGFLAPEITEQKVVAIVFDEEKTVADIHEYLKKDGKPVELVEKITPAEGRQLGIVEQLLGNFGRFNAPGRSVNPGSAGSPGRI